MLELPQKRNRDLVRDYVFEEFLGGCELYHKIEGEEWDRIRDAWAANGCGNPDEMRLVGHHIFGGIHRWDIVSNLVAICDPAHDWCHKMRQAATVLCVWIKLDKGEFDRDLMRACMGKDPIVELERYTLPQWADELRMGIFERF